MIRAKNIRKLTENHYEPENQAKCYKMVWKRFVHPLWGISYRTYLNYLNVDDDEAFPKKEDDGQLNLFSNND